MFSHWKQNELYGIITIIDSDFEETIPIPSAYHLYRIQLTHAIIHIYEKRNLNVAINLVLAF